MKKQKNNVHLKSPDPSQVEEKYFSEADRNEVQEELNKRTGQTAAKTSEEIEMKQKEGRHRDVTTEAAEGDTEWDTDEYYFEDPSNIGIELCSCTCIMLTLLTLFTYKLLPFFESESSWSLCHSNSPVSRLCHEDARGKRQCT